MTSLVPQQLLEQAAEETGLSDFGPDGFRPGLEAYLHSAATEAQLNELGEMAVGAFVTDMLRRRLKLIDWANTHPQVRAERIEAPIIVVGHVPGRDHAAELPARPGSGQPLAAELGGGRQRPAADSGHVA